MTESFFQEDYHCTAEWPEWGGIPRHPLVTFDRAHHGEWMDSVVGTHPLTGAPKVYHIVRCEYCISTHVWPLPTSEDLATYYAKSFYQQTKPEYVARYERDRAWWEECTWRPLVRQCIDNLPTTWLYEKTCPVFIDIGCGPGIALDVAAQLGCDTLGIEPNGELCDKLSTTPYHHDMYCGVLERYAKDAQTQAPELYADILCAYEVLEHQPCPEDFLLTCHSIMNDGGILLIAVPNDYNPYQLLAREQLGLPPWWLSVPDHLHYFTPKTLQLLVRRCGFDILDMRGTYPIDRAIIQGQNYIGNDELGRAVHQQRMQDELNVVHAGQWKEREAYYRDALATQRIGREIIVIARKVTA